MSHCGWPGCGCTGRNVCTAASPDSTVRAEPVLGWRMMGLALEKKWPLSLSLSFWGAWGEGDRWVSCLPGRPRVYVLQDDLDLPSSRPAPSVYCWDYRHAPSHLSDGSLETEPSVSWVLDEHATKRSTSSAPKPQFIYMYFKHLIP